MTTETYNGWENRSTWLAKLHLDNDSKETNELAHSAGVESDTLKQFKNRITTVLIEHTTVQSEQDFDFSDIDYSALWNAFDGKRKCNNKDASGNACWDCESGFESPCGTNQL